MAWWKRLFNKKKKQAPEEDWEQLVYARENVDFADEEQRRKYIENCLEQMTEASREMDLLKGEYALVTAYLADTDEIEALPEEERAEVDRLAGKLKFLEEERAKYRGRKNRMGDSKYYQIRKQENEIEEGINKLKEAENYSALIKQDLQRLDRERNAYEYRRRELEGMLANLRGMAVIFLTALIICVGMLLILQFGFEMNTYVGYILAVSAAAIAITVLCVKYFDAEGEIEKVGKAVSRLVQLQNKVKIRYVNNSQLLNYYYMKYNTDSAAKLERYWQAYQQEKEERKQYAEAEAKTEYYQKALVEKLSGYRVSDPARWINQVSALLDRREMVELRHSLILRRQNLREQLDYNENVAETANLEIRDVAEQYPAYAQEILNMVDRYGL